MKLASWQIFSVGIKVLLAKTLQGIFTRSVRLVYGWGANPAHCEVTHRNPIDRITLFLTELHIAGRGEYARAAIDIMAAPLGGEFAYKETSKSDKGSVDGEAIDTYQAANNLVAEIQNALEDDLIDSAERIRIKEFYRKLIIEAQQLLDAAKVEK